MTNDFMFHYILQKNEKVLRGLICSLLHLEPEQIVSVDIRNPIDISEDIASKKFILDLNIMLNNNTYINLEMQVVNQHNWTDRSLSYLCRSFDHLRQGQEYEDTLPVIHIGFLDFVLFPEVPEFYATNMLMNVKNHHIFSDKLKLCVVDLSHIELATEEDKAYGIDRWARLFKAKTWEEMKEVAVNSGYLKEAAESLFQANEDEEIQRKCWAREEAERHERTMQRDMKLLRNENEELKDKNEELKDKNEKLKDDNIRLKNTEERFRSLTRILIEWKRTDDLLRAATDEVYREKLLKEFGIE